MTLHNHLIRGIVLFPLLLVLFACAINPEPYSKAELAEFGSSRVPALTAGQEVIDGPIDLYEAIARALKYNLDTQVELKEKALRNAQLKLASQQLLPDIVSESIYTGRNNFAGGNSSAILGRRTLGAETLVASSSQQRNIFTERATFTWHILDFGLSYVRAKQAADEVLIAEALKRQVVNGVVESVRTAYWRALSAQRLLRKLRRLRKRVAIALKNTRQLAKDNQTSPITALTFERELLQIKREIENLESDLSVAKTQLAALMNVTPGTKFTLSESTNRTPNLKLKLKHDELIDIAVANRPELHEVTYRQRINKKEAKTAMLELLPGLQANSSLNFDSNSFTFNNFFVGWGASASWNLIRVFQYPVRKKSIEAQDELLNARAKALTVSIMTQVFVSGVRYHHRQHQLQTAVEYHDVQQRLLNQVRASAEAGRVSEQTLVREEMNALVSEVRRDIAYADLQNAYANIYSSIGLDPYHDNVDLNLSVDALAAELRNVWLERGDYNARIAAKKSSPSS